MRTLKSLLERFTRSLSKDELARQAAVSCVEEVLGFNIPDDSISMKGDTLTIKASPTKKNEIKLHEAKILEGIQERCQIKLSRILYI